jgi:protein gp37
VGRETGIQWCHHTASFWRGCTDISPGCLHCYAEDLARINPAVLGEWGPKGRRAIAAESYWRQPLAWDRAAEAAGERRRVFFSLGDPFEDRPELEAPRLRMFGLMGQTPHLDWLLLTKRPGFARGWIAGHPLPDNCWLGVSVEDQQWADGRIPVLRSIPARVRFLSVEPLLGPIVLPDLAGIAWAIVGGESGRRARPCDPDWIRSIVGQCRSAGVAPFVKQDSGPKSGRQGRIPVDIWAIKEFPG